MKRLLWKISTITFLTVGWNSNELYAQDKNENLAKPVLTFSAGHFFQITHALIEPNNKYVITSSIDIPKSTNSSYKLWDVATSKLLKTVKQDEFSDIVVSDRHIITAGFDRKVKLANIKDETTTYLTRNTAGIVKLLLSQDNQYLVAFSEFLDSTYLWNLSDISRVKVFKGSAPRFSANSNYLSIRNESNTDVIDIQSTQLIFKVRGYSGGFTENHKRYVTLVPNESGILLSDVDASSKSTKKLFKNYKFRDIKVSPDGERLLALTDSGTNQLTLLDPNSKFPLFQCTIPKSKIRYENQIFSFSNSGKSFLVVRNDDKVKKYTIDIVNSITGRLIKQIHSTSEVQNTRFSSNDKYILFQTGKNHVTLWDLTLDKVALKIEPTSIVPNPTSIAKDLPKNQSYHLKTEDGVYFSIMNGDDEIIKLIQFDSVNRVVIHASGLFDATPNAMAKLYFVQGLDIVDLKQLKERYYEPGLWKKVMNGEKLRNVVGMKSIELPPDISVGQVDEKGYLPIELTNKGGGFGAVTVFINGKEAIADARTKGADSKAPSLSLKVFVANHKSLVKGRENFIGVKAWNEGHWVVSRGEVVSYRKEGNETAYRPAIHIIACGVSDYTGTELDLKYAAKDAEDVGKALILGARNLFGTERSYMYNLTTNNTGDNFPTKSNILKAFEKVSSTTHPLDVVVVYLSGHGINHGGQDGDWYYLTQDAFTSSSTAYNDPEVRRNSTLSSAELVELFKTVPALKQVLMIDACASGKVVESLMAKKDIESSTLRALDRMRDRTGLHIITGCTADAVSYEASKYGQGVLTYSLLEGIRGAALREDQFVDINKLFQYAHDRVPLLAEGIGGIQTPQIFSPQGAQSFDIGQLDEVSKKAIPIATIRPVYIRSTFLDDDQLEDALQLGKKIDDALNEAASKGTNSNIIFVDVRDYPEGCKLSGRYKQEKGIIKLKLRKKCGGNDETIDIEGKTVDEIKDKILSKL